MPGDQERAHRDVPGDLRKVVGPERRESGRERVAVTATRATALFNRVRSHNRAQRLEAGRGRVHVGESGKIAVLHGFLVLAIHAVHLLAGEVEGERLDEGREDARLDELVVDYLRLGRLATVVRLRRITVGKLTADRAVADRNRRRTSHD